MAVETPMRKPVYEPGPALTATASLNLGKGSEVLMQIDRVGREMSMAQGMCGASSGSIPTNVGQPQIRIKSMTVGGKGGAL